MSNKTFQGLQEAKHYITELIPREEQGRYHKEIFDAIDDAVERLQSPNPTIAKMVERLDEQSDTIFRLRKEMAQAEKFRVTLMHGGERPNEVRYTRSIATARLWCAQAEHSFIEIHEQIVE